VSTLPPGPSDPPVLQLVRWLTRPIAFLESCRRRYGDTFSVQFPGFERPMVMLSDPEAIKALYTAHEHGLPRGRTITLLPILGADSILLLEGSEHLARRKLMLPPFHGERMRSYESIMRQTSERQLERWPEEEPFAVHPHMQAITLEVILEAVFGVTDHERAGLLRERLPRLLAETSSPMLQLRFMLAGRFGHGDPLARVREINASIDELLFAEIAERRATGVDGREDILSLLIAARFEDGEAMSDRELRDQLVTLLLAGHETTATALAWTLDLLVRHPAALARLTAEVDAGEDDAYLRAVTREALRLRPVVPLAGRRLSSELQVGELRLDVGTDVTPAIWLTHTRADLYPEPYAFRPERFLDGAPGGYGWIPFGGGIRRCLGASFAEMEMRVVLETVLRSAVLESASPRAERVTRRNVTFSPRRGTLLRSRRRMPAPVVAEPADTLALVR
jgi:cytochrome P450 family 135